MKNRTIALAFTLVIALSLGVFSTLPGVLAIGEVTPTPGAQPQPTQPPAPAEPLDDAAVEALFDQALSAFQAGNFEEAIRVMDEVLAADPENAEAWVVRGLAYGQQGDFERSIDDVTQAILLVPWAWDFYTFRGDAYAQAGEFNEALNDYGTALELNPRYEQAHASRSAVLRLLSRNDEARVYETIAQGIVAFESGSGVDAVGLYSDAISLAGGDERALAYAYYNRGLAFYTLEDLTSAIEDYTEAARNYPNMHDAYLARGIAYREDGDIESAGVDFLRRIELLENETVTETVPLGDTRDVEMAYGNVYRLSFEGRGGDTVTLAARDLEGVSVDPLIVLLNEAGEPIAGDDDFGGGLDSLIEDFRLPSDGIYTLVVSHANGGFNGVVRVTLGCTTDIC